MYLWGNSSNLAISPYHAYVEVRFLRDGYIVADIYTLYDEDNKHFPDRMKREEEYRSVLIKMNEPEKNRHLLAARIVKEYLINSWDDLLESGMTIDQCVMEYTHILNYSESIYNALSRMWEHRVKE